VYGAEVWQIPTRETNKILSTEVDVLRRKKKEARKSRMGRINNEQIKEIMGVKGKPDIIDIIERKRLRWYGHVKTIPKENTKTNYGMDTTGEKKKRMPKRNVDGRSTSSHDNKKFRIRSMKKQRGMVSGFPKTATAVKNTGWIDRPVNKHLDRPVNKHRNEDVLNIKAHSSL
jgi:hypothetical protein